MLNIVYEDLWKVDHPASTLVAVTTNGVIVNPKLGQPRLVMGAGSAKEMVFRKPSVPYWAAIKITENYSYRFITPRGRIYLYGFLPLLYPNQAMGLGLFQTKLDWTDPGSLAAIEYSVSTLKEFCAANPAIHVRLPFPGIGLGGLKEEEVLPRLAPLEGQNITFCKR